MNDRQFPWLILVPQVANVSEIYHLDDQQQALLLNEINDVGEKLMQNFSGDKLNTAALGNMVSQLHIHLIVRFKGDVAWPNPVWGQQAPQHYSKQQLRDLQAQLSMLLKTSIREASPC